MLFIIISALHVSGGFFTHHQELIKLFAALGIVMLTCCLPLVWVGWNSPQPHQRYSRKARQYPRMHIQFYKLLMMGGKTPRNMWSADNNKEQCVSCISLVI